MGRGARLSSDRGVCWWGELLAAVPSAAHGGCPSQACLTGVSSVAVLGSSFLPRDCAGVDSPGRLLLANGVDFLALFLLVFLALSLLVSSTLPGNFPVFSNQIHPADLQQEVRVPVVGRHPGLAAGPLLHGVHPSLDRLQTLHHQRLPQRGEAGALGSGNGLCFCVEIQPCRGIICVLQVK